MVNSTPSRLAQWLRMIVAPPAQADVYYGSTASLNAQFWLSQFPWRPTAAWSVVAAMVAGDMFGSTRTVNWQTLALVLLLADPLWGSIWRLAAGRKELLPLHLHAQSIHFWLPYMQPNSPAHKLLRWDSADVTPLLLRVVLPTMAIALAIALALGFTALALTSVVALISVLGWTSRRTFATQPVLLQSVVSILLPWLLTTHQVVGTDLRTTWLTASTALALLVTIHHWGEGRLMRNHHDWFGAAILAVAEIGITGLLIIVQAPLWLGLLAVLWLPAWLAIYQRQPVARLNFWWLAALLVAALGLHTV